MTIKVIMARSAVWAMGYDDDDDDDGNGER